LGQLRSFRASKAWLFALSRYNLKMCHFFFVQHVARLMFVVAFGCMLLTTTMLAAQAGIHDSAPTPSNPVEASRQTQPHRFWDHTNLILFSGVALFRGLDYASTRNFQARGRQEILLPDDVVNNSAGFAALEGAGTAASVGLSYWMHRAGHHRIERWVSVAHIGVNGFGVVRNYSLESKHPPPPPPR
jgi:hypothetical protein